MDRLVPEPQPTDISRRRVIQALAALGITGPLALELAAQPRAQLSVDVIKQASVVLGEQFTPDRVMVIEKALQRNLEQFQAVRDLVIDDLVEPAPMFMARSHAGSLAGPSGSK